MLALRTERTDVPRRSVNQPVADHLVLPLEPFAAFGARAVWLRAVMRPVLGVHVGVRAGASISSGENKQKQVLWELT